MTKADRAELERLVQLIERRQSDWSAREIERELSAQAPVSYGNWKDDTPNLRARLRQVQRWRSGVRGNGRRETARLAYTFLWPMGEHQRRSLDPTFPARDIPRRASHRIFLYNCSSETVREVRAKVDRMEVTYEPALAPGGFTELHWTRNPTIREGLLRSSEHQLLQHSLDVEFAVSNGVKRASLKGVLRLDATDGWTGFLAHDRSEKEIE